MKKTCLPLLFVAVVVFVACKTGVTNGFVGVRDGAFYRNGCPYEFNGTNMWYAAILGSRGQGVTGRGCAVNWIHCMRVA